MTEEHYILILQKRLSGEITPEEEKQLSDWLSQSPDNQRIADSVESIWQTSESFSNEIKLDMDADFSSIEKKLGIGEKKEAVVRTLPSRRRWLRIAAAILLLAAAPFVIKNFLQPAVKYQVVYTEDKPLKEAVELPDGSKVYLNAHSELSHFTTSISGERRVKLTGEAFFDVARDTERPFIVETQAGEVTVLGTSFSVKNEKGEADLTVHVATGKVQMQPSGSEKKLILVNEESGYYKAADRTLQKVKNKSMNELSWHTKKITFEGSPLSEVLTSIGQSFDTQIELIESSISDCPVHATINLKSVESAAQTLATLLGAEIVKVEEKKYELRGGRCE